MRALREGKNKKKSNRRLTLKKRKDDRFWERFQKTYRDIRKGK